MAVKKTIIIDAKTDQAVKDIDNVNEALDDTTKEQEEVAKGFGIMDTKAGQFYTSSIKGFKGLIAGLRTTIQSMGVLKVAIAATGIGLLLVAFASLTAFFTKTQRGADALNVVFKAVGTTIDVLIDRLSTFGEGLFQIITGDFSAGIATLKGSFAGLGEEIRNESQAAIQLEKDFQKLQDRDIEFIKVQAEKRRVIAAARLATEDASKTEQERLDALKLAIATENELTDEQIAIETERARIIRERVALGESSREDLEDQARAEARVIELQTERDTRLKELQSRLNSFNATTNESTEATNKDAAASLAAAEAKKKEAAALDELNKKRQEAIDRLVAESQANQAQGLEAALLQADALEEEFLNRSLERQEIEKNAVNDKYFSAIEAARMAGQDITTLEQARQQEIADIDASYNAEELQRERLIQSAKAQLVSMGLNALLANMKEGSKAAKAIAVAQATYDTYQAIQSTFASAAANPTSILFPAQPYIQAGIAAAFGFANVRKILSTQPAASSAPSLSAPSGFGGVQAPTVQFNTLQGGLNQLQQAITSQNQPPPKAYVVTTEINNANQLDRRIASQSIFG